MFNATLFLTRSITDMRYRVIVWEDVGMVKVLNEKRETYQSSKKEKEILNLWISDHNDEV
jgi:hypothetical protein